VKLIGLGLVALLLLAGSAVRAVATSSSTAVAGACVLPIDAHGDTSSVDVAPAHRHHHHRTRSGNLVVSIPPTVFIRTVGPHLVVTTNTGRPPRPSDTFYAIGNGQAALASAALQRYVESACR
jgi:hypothetical protein